MMNKEILYTWHGYPESAFCERLQTNLKFERLTFDLKSASALWVKELKQYLTNLKYFIFVLHCNRYSSWHW